MRYLLIGLVLTLVIFVVTQGHVVFLPLFFALPLGGMFMQRRRNRW